MGEAWKSGDWVDARRVRLVCAFLLAATILGYGFLLSMSHGTLDAQGRPIGTDFSDVYAAGWMADHGRAAAAWVWPEHYKVQQALHHSKAVPFYGWHYPPPFLLLASLLATMPYLAALALWLGTTLAGAVMVARKIVPGPGTTLAVLAAPASFVCIGHGQNAFLTASLLAGGLALLDRRPWTAGLLLGCLVYKPQFAVLLPVVLIAAGNRRAFAGAAISSLGLVAITLAIWGWPVWQAFHDSLILTRTRVIETGETGWEKIVTSFATARALGAPIPLAYGFQAISTALAIAGAALAARWASPALRGATVCCAALLSTPYAMDYDLVILGGALCFLVADARERGWLGHEKSILAIAYLVPFVGRQIAALTLVPLDWITLVAVFAITLRRAWVLDFKFLPKLVLGRGTARRRRVVEG
ncbi:glycosyltransferase family 87 protein [Sphingomonas oryzagri]|uniref:Glycosyltransferase family 87 protein n=1 Tax=Sphingomonas oryzagri TaxID=3042314 RepID=A0ABT6MYF6_9SPHN|nr:glycosyltransferase family 87 protein [Sphingomonas oryzagri]MDH7637811.1 glycosyltransferase family 87 protein [Sphingomonas oryzagri]